MTVEPGYEQVEAEFPLERDQEHLKKLEVRRKALVSGAHR